MNKNVIFAIIAIIVVFLGGFFLGRIEKKTTTEPEITSSDSEDLFDFKQIHISENLSKKGKVENLKNVSWSRANIMQYGTELELSIDLNNESETEKVEAREITVNLLDKEGKVRLTKDINMPEIAENYGYTILNLEFEIEEVMIIHDIQIIAK